MATDTTNHTDLTNNAPNARESDVGQVHLTQSDAPLQVQVPQGENVVRVQVTPGQTIELPFPTDGLMARLGDNGNLAVRVGDITVILVGYADATGQGYITIVGNDGKSVDVAAVLASTDPNLDIQTAAGPGAGDQGQGADNDGGNFSPFDPNSGIGGLNAIGGLDPTVLQYGLIQNQFIEIIEADEEEEEDTSPDIISIKNGNPVNEDDLGGGRGEVGVAKAFEPYPSHLIADLMSKLGGTSAWFGGPNGDGNDPFDTDDHEDGSQVVNHSDNNNGVDQDREPTTVTAIAQIDFHHDVPGHLSFSNGVTTPIVDQLTALNLASHSNLLQYAVLPGAADDPATGLDESHGETLVAYYMVGEGEQAYAIIVFTIGMREFDGSVNPVDINVDFTIYGVIDNVSGIADVDGDITDILDIEVPFFAIDSDGSVTSAPDGALVFHDIDDTPSLGSLSYNWVDLNAGQEGPSDWAWVPTQIVPSDTDIIHDETHGVQGNWLDQSDEDDVNQDWYSSLRDSTLVAAGLPIGTVLGMSISSVTVSFGADGAAAGNIEAGKTIYTGDSDTTYSHGFQLFLGTVDAPKSGGTTNWSITENDVVLTVKAEQIDANTIVGYASDSAGGRIEVFVLRIDPDSGEVIILQLHQVNHADGTNADDANSSLLIGGQPVNFASTDYDGDRVTSPLSVIIEDDGPKICEQLQATIDKDSKNYNDDGSNDDGLPGANQGGPGDVGDGTNNPYQDYIGFAGKSLNISYGTDGPAVNPITFATAFIAKDAEGAPITLMSGGFPVLLTWAGNVLTAKANGIDVFTLTVHQATGTVDFQLKAPIDHPWHDADSNNNPGGTEYEDMISLELGFTAKDSDNDSVSGTVVINVNDDSPDACCLDAVTIKEVSETHEFAAGSITINASNYLREAQVLTSATSPTGAASVLVNQNEGGVNAIGVASPGSNGEARYNEINYVGDGSNANSEALIFELQNGSGQAADGKYAVKASVDLNVFFAGEGGVGSEVGTYTLYKDGVQVAGPISFTASMIGGNGGFHLDINWPTGFDKIEFKALPGTSDQLGNQQGDSSDYNVKEIKLDLIEQVATPTEIVGKVCADFGADGPAAGDAAITLAVENGGTTGVTYNGADVINVLSADGNTIFGKAGDTIIWKLTIVDATKDYTFTLYEKVDGDVDPTLEFRTIVTDRDGDQDPGCITVTIDQNDIPTLTIIYDQTVEVNKGLVDEDFLSGGAQDSPASPGDNSGGVSATGHYDANFKSDAPGTVELAVAEGSDTSINTLSGANILWHQASPNEVIGYVQGGNPSNIADQYFKLTLTPGANASNTGDGIWNFTLLKPVQHQIAGAEDDLNLSVGVKATDNNGDSATGSINIQIDDDMPIAISEPDRTVSEPGAMNFNVMLILDLSRSMDAVVSGGATRLDVAQAALINLINAYSAAGGNVSFQLTTFAATGSLDAFTYTKDGSSGHTLQQLIDKINGFQENQLVSETDYDDAVIAAAPGLTNWPVAGATQTNLVYFLSDGVPQGSGDLTISDQEETIWEAALAAKGATAYAVGIDLNNGVDQQHLQDVAYPDNNVFLTSSGDLSSILQGTVPQPNTITGNVLANDMPGADGYNNTAQPITQITVGGIVYTLASPNGGTVNGSQIIVNTGVGALKFNFTTGAWEFTSASVAADTVKQITYTVIDRDGDTSVGSLNIKIINITENVAPVNTMPTVIHALEDTAKVIAGLSVADIDAGSGQMKVTLSVQHGDLSVNTAGTGATATGNNSETVVLTGTLAQINTALSGNHVTYTPDNNYAGEDHLSMITSDQGNTGAGGAKSDTDNVLIHVIDTDVANPTSVPLSYNTGNTIGLGNGNFPGNGTTYDDSGNASRHITDNASSDNNGSHTLNGNGGNDWLEGMSGNDVLNGGNGNDYLDGGAGFDKYDGANGTDTMKVDLSDMQSLGRQISGGSGDDMLDLSGIGVAQAWNFEGTATNANSGHFGITNIEVLGLESNGAQTVTLDAQSVLDMTDGRDTLVVRGDAGSDVVNLSDLSGSWNQVGTNIAANDGRSYDVFQANVGGSTATVYVDRDLGANVHLNT